MPELFPSFIFYNFAVGSLASYETEYSMFIRNISQTIIPIGDEIYADVPSKTYAGWGTDGIYNETYENDSFILDTYLGKWTIFFNRYMEVGAGGTEEWTENMMADLLRRGHEFGIHTNTQATYSQAEIEDLNEQFTYLTNMAMNNSWTNASFAWTSLGNDYDHQYNDYAFNIWGGIGRKVWTHPYDNLGHLFNIGSGVNTMIKNCAQKGYSYIGYYHRSTGEIPEVDAEKVYQLLNESIENHLEIVGYMEYWIRYAAPEYVTGTILSNTDDLKLLNIEYDLPNITIPDNIRFEIKISERTLDIDETDDIMIIQNNETLNFHRENEWILVEVAEGDLEIIVGEKIDRTVLNVPFTSPIQVDNHIFPGHYIAYEPVEEEMEVKFNGYYDCAELVVNRNVSGQFVMAGFIPSLETTISFEFKMDNYVFNGASFGLLNNLFSGSVTYYQSYLQFAIMYYNATGTVKTWLQNSENFGSNNIPWMKYTLTWHKNRTYHFNFSTLAGDWYFSGYNKTRQQYMYDDMPELFPSFFLLHFSPGSLASYNTDYSMYIRNLRQTITVKANDIYADIPMYNYAGWGTDGIYNETYENDSFILSNNDAKFTIFWDTALEVGMGGTEEWTEEMMADTLARGHEFGIHTNTQADYNETEVNDLNEQFIYLTNMAMDNSWTNASFAWTSLGNDYVYCYNDYAFNQWGSIGRKIWTHPYANLGHLFNIGETDNTMTFNLAERGISYIGYYHRSTGEIPEVDAEKVYQLLNESIENHLEIVGYMEYWIRYAAPEYVTGTIITNTDDLKVINIEYNLPEITIPDNVKFEIRISEQALDYNFLSEFKIFQNGEELEFERYYGWIVVDVTEGNITIETQLWTTAKIPSFIAMAGFLGMIISPALFIAMMRSERIRENKLFILIALIPTLIMFFGCFYIGVSV